MLLHNIRNIMYMTIITYILWYLTFHQSNDEIYSIIEFTVLENYYINIQILWLKYTNYMFIY